MQKSDEAGDVSPGREGGLKGAPALAHCKQQHSFRGVGRDVRVPLILLVLPDTRRFLGAAVVVAANAGGAWTPIGECAFVSCALCLVCCVRLC